MSFLCQVISKILSLSLMVIPSSPTDGTPLAPTSDPVQTSDSLYSVTIDWGESPHPTRDPLQGYTLLLTELLEVEREIRFESFSNNTNAEIPNLKAGVEYRVVVFGRNQMGEGQRSHYVVARTVSPIVPHPPTNVAVKLEIGNISSNIILYWTVSIHTHSHSRTHTHTHTHTHIHTHAHTYTHPHTHLYTVVSKHLCLSILCMGLK